MPRACHGLPTLQEHGQTDTLLGTCVVLEHVSAFKVLRNVLYKFSTYLLTQSLMTITMTLRRQR